MKQQIKAEQKNPRKSHHSHALRIGTSNLKGNRGIHRFKKPRYLDGNGVFRRVTL
jgi:hypothetical protein